MGESIDRNMSMFFSFAEETKRVVARPFAVDTALRGKTRSGERALKEEEEERNPYREAMMYASVYRGMIYLRTGSNS